MLGEGGRFDYASSDKEYAILCQSVRMKVNTITVAKPILTVFELCCTDDFWEKVYIQAIFKIFLSRGFQRKRGGILFYAVDYPKLWFFIGWLKICA